MYYISKVRFFLVSVFAVAFALSTFSYADPSKKTIKQRLEERRIAKKPLIDKKGNPVPLTGRDGKPLTNAQKAELGLMGTGKNTAAIKSSNEATGKQFPKAAFAPTPPPRKDAKKASTAKPAPKASVANSKKGNGKIGSTVRRIFRK